MLSRFPLTFTTLLLSTLLAFCWALLLFYHSPTLHPDHVSWGRSLRSLVVSLMAFLLFCTAALLPIRRPIAVPLTLGFGLLFFGLWQQFLHDLMRPDWALAHAIHAVTVPLGLLIATLGLYQMGRAYRSSRQALGQFQQLEHDLATTDQLTQLYNRRHFFATGGPSFTQALHEGKYPVVVSFRILNLTEINRQLGLKAGDELLVLAGKILKHQLRPGQMAARMGGRRFAVLFLDVPEQVAEALFQQVRTRLEHALLTGDDGRRHLVSVAVGYRVGAAHADDTLERLTRRTDPATT